MQFRAWQLVTFLVRRLPLRLSYGLAAAAGTTAYFFWPRGHRSLQRNYLRVLPGARPRERRRVARLSLVNYCRYLVDFVRFPAMNAATVVASVDGDGNFRDLDAALARGKGVVIVCMHFGNWDLGAGAAAARGYPLAVVVETFANPRLDAMVVESRQRLGMKVIRMERAGPSLLRTLKENGILALLIDRPVPGEGVRVKFFGEEVEVPAGPARLALRTGAAVVPTAFARQHPYRPEVLTLTDFGITLPTAGSEDEKITAVTQAIMDSHERFIRSYPEQWYMFREMWPTPRR